MSERDTLPLIRKFGVRQRVVPTKVFSVRERAMYEQINRLLRLEYGSVSEGLAQKIITLSRLYREPRA